MSTAGTPIAGVSIRLIGSSGRYAFISDEQGQFGGSIAAGTYVLSAHAPKFMPVSATLQLSELGSLNAALISCAPTKPKFKCPFSPPNVALFYGRVTLRISDVEVNGQPLNVGPHCQTATPFNLELVGLPPTYNISAIEGILTGTITVPQFSGCANGPDNLDPIFDATVSGPGNFAKINQAPFCAPQTTGAPGCPPVKPTPTH